MKNISRRVFIKGMAVAAAATAASTVLAGCNIVPGKDEPVVVPGFKSETKTLTVDEQDVVITTTGFGYTAAGALVVDLTVVNNGDSAVDLAYDNNLAASKNVGVTAYFDGEYNMSRTVSGAATNVPASTDSVSNVANVTVTIPNEPEKWETLTLVFARKIKEQKEITFVLNK